MSVFSLNGPNTENSNTYFFGTVANRNYQNPPVKHAVCMCCSWQGAGARTELWPTPRSLTPVHRCMDMFKMAGTPKIPDVPFHVVTNHNC